MNDSRRSNRKKLLFIIPGAILTVSLNPRPGSAGLEASDVQGHRRAVDARPSTGRSRRARSAACGSSARARAQVIGRAVSYADLTPEQYAAPMEEQGAPEWWVQSMLALENVKRQGWAEAVTSHVEEITGRAPETYRAFIERNRARIS